jgi:hypothetical protein
LEQRGEGYGTKKLKRTAAELVRQTLVTQDLVEVIVSGVTVPCLAICFLLVRPAVIGRVIDEHDVADERAHALVAGILDEEAKMLGHSGTVTHNLERRIRVRKERGEW